MGFEQLIMAAQNWGPTAITTIIAFVISYLFRQQTKNAVEDSEREKKLKESLASGLNRIEQAQNKTLAEVKAELEKQRNELAALKMDKLDKEDFYRDMGGWRSEINRLQDLIIAQNSEMIGKIIELWKST